MCVYVISIEPFVLMCILCCSAIHFPQHSHRIWKWNFPNFLNTFQKLKNEQQKCEWGKQFCFTRKKFDFFLLSVQVAKFLFRPKRKRKMNCVHRPTCTYLHKRKTFPTFVHYFFFCFEKDSFILAFLFINPITILRD